MIPLSSRSSGNDEHADAVARRLATLSAELAVLRGDPPAVHRHTQVRGLGHGGPPLDRPPVPSEETGPREPVDPVPPVPVPGRHASRDRVGALNAGLSARLPLNPSHLAVICVVVAVAIGFAAWLAVRADPTPVVDAEPASEPLTELAAQEEPSGSTGPGAVPASTGSEEVTVDVAGKVRRPGIAILDPGARVVDALEAAGGARRGVDLTSLNLARPLVDGEQILVGVSAPAGPVGALGSAGDAASPGSPAGGSLVNINTADQVGLESLPGVGPVTAEKILAWRTEHGGFTAVEELLEVDGIGDATLAEIAPHVTI